MPDGSTSQCTNTFSRLASLNAKPPNPPRVPAPGIHANRFRNTREHPAKSHLGPRQARDRTRIIRRPDHVVHADTPLRIFVREWLIDKREKNVLLEIVARQLLRRREFAVPPKHKIVSHIYPSRSPTETRLDEVSLAVEPLTGLLVSLKLKQKPLRSGEASQSRLRQDQL